MTFGNVKSWIEGRTFCVGHLPFIRYKIHVLLPRFRNQIVKMWCAKAQTWGAHTGRAFDIPDFMHVEGLYTTHMDTRAYRTVDGKGNIIFLSIIFQKIFKPFFKPFFNHFSKHFSKIFFKTFFKNIFQNIFQKHFSKHFSK